MISIIIPVCNQADKLSRCLDSILAQTILTSLQYEITVSPLLKGSRGILEITIVNDGSTDNVKEVYEYYKENFNLKSVNFQLINQNNKGANAARNRGAQEAKGEYLLFCDADIEMEPEMLEIMLKTLADNPQTGFAYSSFKFGFKTFKLYPYSAGKLKKMPYIHTTSLIRQTAFPGFDENIKKFQDWDLWLTMLAQGHTGIWIDKVLFKVKTGGTMSSWLPSFAYKLMPFLPSVKKYKKAMGVIKKKHNLV